MKISVKAARVWLLSGLLAGLPLAHAADDAAAPPARGKTVVDVRTDKIILMDLAATGDRLVAVGERGFALTSDDAAKTWKARETPVTRTLTGVAFANPQVGIAVGHGGSLVRTEDGGGSWTAIPLEEAGSDSLLGVTHLGGDHFVAYGAFGLYFDSADAGKTWQQRKILGEDFDRHISQIIAAGSSIILVAESGTLARSDDGGATWTALTSPYVGSYFGAVVTKDGAVLAFGMRGNFYRSIDLGATWQKIDLATKTSMNAGRQLADGRILLVGNSGLLALSRDGGHTFEVHWSPAGKGFAALAEAGGSIVLAGETGITLLDPSWLEAQ